MPALDDPPAADPSDDAVLTIAGRSDPYGRFAPALEAALRDRGAQVDARWTRAGHEFGPEDVVIVREWAIAETP